MTNGPPPWAAGSDKAHPLLQSQDPSSNPPNPKSTLPSALLPPSELLCRWDVAVRSFLVRVGLTQALHGFDADMLVMNSEWERSEVPKALDILVKDIQKLGQQPQGRSLEDRKLDYVRLINGAEPGSQTSINKSISAFLAYNRARNDASNRDEFLHSATQKRRRSGEVDSEIKSSCARTDAKPIDRDVQMKYDIAKNEEGPLRRTIKGEKASLIQGTKDLSHTQLGDSGAKTSTDNEDNFPAACHPGLDERLGNIETHLSVRYVPTIPRTLLTRLKFLEDHIVRIEKDYPPWAALHFNQPNRGWPPPPRPTPIIVPAHLRSAQDNPPSLSVPNSRHSTFSPTRPILPPKAFPEIPNGSRPRNTTSSLHRAVMERLEVQQALSDLVAGV